MENDKIFCLPMMSVDEERKKVWFCFATATFAYVRDSFFLVSPAHAFEGMNEKTPVYIAIDEPITLAGHGIKTNKEMDIAAIKLGNSTVNKIEDIVLFVTPELVQNYPSRESMQRSMVLGFPSNRNTMKVRKRGIGKSMLAYTANDISGSFFPDKEYKEEFHFALEYEEKKLLDGDLKKTQPRNMHGVSGGLISELLFEDVYISGSIQGILLGSKKEKKALVGLRYEYILAWIDENFDSFPEAPH